MKDLRCLLGMHAIVWASVPIPGQPSGWLRLRKYERCGALIGRRLG